MNSKLILAFLFFLISLLLLFYYLKLESNIIILLSVIIVLLINKLIVQKEYFNVHNNKQPNSNIMIEILRNIIDDIENNKEKTTTSVSLNLNQATESEINSANNNSSKKTNLDILKEILNDIQSPI